MKYNRIFTIVLDSVGAGAMHDADKYGDVGTDTLGHTAKAVGGISMPNRKKLGLVNLQNIVGVKRSESQLA